MNWAVQHDIDTDVLPFQPIHLALFFKDLSENTEVSDVTLASFSAAISYLHNSYGLESPMNSLIAQNSLRAARKITGREKKRKEPVTEEMMVKICSSYKIDKSLENLRFILGALMQLHGFLRASDLLKIQRAHICLKKDHFSIFLESSKTDKLRRGYTLLINENSENPIFCPVFYLKEYLTRTGMLEISNKFLFRRIVAIKGRKKTLAARNVPMTYACLRDILLKKLKLMGYNELKYGTHSFRSGGATLCCNKEVDLELIKLQGMWRSEAVQSYLKRDKQQRLIASKCISKQLNLMKKI